jgi:AraC-like DNA-binding protein
MIPVREHVSYSPDASFASFVRGWPRIVCSYHLHEELELVHVISSEGTLLAGDGISQFKPGDVFMFGANLPHIFRNWPGLTYGRAGAKTHVIQFRYNFLGAAFFNAPEMRKIKKLLDRSSRGFRFTGRLSQKISAAMIKVHESKDSLRISTLVDLLETAANSPEGLASLSNSRAAAANASVDTRLERVFDYVYDNFGTEVTFDHAVKLACMTPSAFSRFFRQATTLSFTEFLNRLRISNACRLLVGTNQPITQIAFESGFGNLSYFNRQFKLQTGRSPRTFRSVANG